MTRLTDILHLAAGLWTLGTLVTDTATLPSSYPTCPVNCTCAPKQISCQDRVPKNVPDAVEEINIKMSGLRKTFSSGIFCNLTWQNVKTMSIVYNGNTFSGVILDDSYFHCLQRLQTLKMRSVFFSSPVRNINLTDLVNVVTLEINRGFQLYEQLYRLFSSRQNFPNLVSFSFTSAEFYVTLDDTLVAALSQRKIRVLNFSFSMVHFNFHNPGTLCDTLSELILFDSDITIEFLPRECSSLKYVDLSGVNYLVNEFKRRCLFRNNVIHMETFFHAHTLYMNKMFTASLGKFIPSCVLDFTHINTGHVIEFRFSQNVLPRFEIRFFNNYLEYINLSQNRIETIHPDTFLGLPSCKNIDLSSNKLHAVGTLEAVLSNTFKSNHLEVAAVSSNNLQFSGKNDGLFHLNLDTEPIKLQLQNNSLTKIDFNFSHVYNLKLLDLRFNKIQNLDSRTKQQLEDLYNAQQQQQKLKYSNISLAILLEGNPLSCSCDNLEFVQWFAKSPVFENTRQNQHCLLNQQKYTLDNNAVNMAIDDCEKAARKRKVILLSTILPGISVGILSFVFISIYRQRKRRLVKHKMEDSLRLVQENKMKFKFPVFLSYSSLDLEFVVDHVRQPLQRHLQAITQANRDLVCDADIHFIPGHNIYQEMSRCIEESAVFVAVLSENYCKSDHCQIEIAEARTTGKPILLIFKEHVDEDMMQIVIREIFHKFTRIKFVKEEGQYRIQPGWEQVCESIIQML